jgi:anti-sigma B factor antagonist
MSEESKILVTLRDNRAFIAIMGEGTFRIAGQLKRTYQNLISEGVTKFTLDLQKCTLLDSTFLGILLGLAIKLKDDNNGELCVANANASLRQLLKDLGLERIIRFEIGQ